MASNSLFVLFVEACVTQSILALLYALTIVRMYYLKSTMNFVLFCCVLLISAALCWIVVCGLGYDLSAHDSAKILRLQIFFTFVNNVTFASAIWLFAMRFWSVQYTIKLQILGQDPG